MTWVLISGWNTVFQPVFRQRNKQLFILLLTELMVYDF